MALHKIIDVAIYIQCIIWLRNCLEENGTFGSMTEHVNVGCRWRCWCSSGGQNPNWME